MEGGPDAPLAPERSPARLSVLKEGDTFLVADAYGDVVGEEDGLFSNDTRVLSTLRLEFAGSRPSLLSSGVGQDNVFFIAHLTNRPLPPLGSEPVPEGLIHIERKRFLWKDRVFERIGLVNYGDRTIEAPLALRFAADFRDMFEVRGQQRAHRGKFDGSRIGERGVEIRYRGLDGLSRRMAIDFSATPERIEAGRADFIVRLAARGAWELYLEIGGEPAQPGRARYRHAAAQARRHMRGRRRPGARVQAGARLFQSWLDKSRADLALLTTDLPGGPYPYAGIPWFSTPFGRDAIVTALQMLWLDPGLARGVLTYLASNQAKETSAFRDAEPGKIMHETRKGEMAAVNELPFGKYYGGVDTTPLFVMLAGAYAERTADLAFIEQLRPALEAAAGWIVRSAASHPLGLLAYARFESSGLFNQGWKDSHDSIFHADGSTPPGPIALVEVQGYAYRAYSVMAQLAHWRGDAAAAAGWRERADALRATVEHRFWLEDRQFYALALDGEGRPCEVRASNAGHLLYAGLPHKKRGLAVARQLASRAFNSGWGIRTLAPEAARFSPMSYHNGSVWPHDVALCAAGIARYGEREAAVLLLNGIFEAAVHFGMRLPELFCGFAREAGEAPIAYPVACLPQAWAAGSAFMLLQACLGLRIDAHRHTVQIEQPSLPPGVDRLRIGGLRIGEQRLDLLFQRIGDRVVAAVEGQDGPQPVNVVLRL
ncbi:amylo-alpha-1,6-glucosidase [Pigmentiphaga soli]|uniref:Amylo-alpha-1,6-glucosidase n=1 Tax=Pigmentiphaga soli TaxID=1007095 RepID=A0ABP8HMP8_9BURK